jgi:hypothetical protein
MSYMSQRNQPIPATQPPLPMSFVGTNVSKQDDTGWYDGVVLAECGWGMFAVSWSDGSQTKMTAEDVRAHAAVPAAPKMMSLFVGLPEERPKAFTYPRNKDDWLVFVHSAAFKAGLPGLTDDGADAPPWLHAVEVRLGQGTHAPAVEAMGEISSGDTLIFVAPPGADTAPRKRAPAGDSDSSTTPAKKMKAEPAVAVTAIPVVVTAPKLEGAGAGAADLSSDDDAPLRVGGRHSGGPFAKPVSCVDEVKVGARVE